MSSLRLDGQDVSPPEREGEEGDVLTEMNRQTGDFLGWGKETILSERQVAEEEENKNKETAFLVTRTDRQTLAFVVVRLIVSTRIGAIVARSHFKHRKNCECCPGHYLIVNHCSSMS